MCGANMLLGGGYECFSRSTVLDVCPWFGLQMCLTEMFLSTFSRSVQHCASIVPYVGAQECSDTVVWYEYH